MENLINALNILEINTNTNEECMICKDELKCQQCYTLPECNHTYHTNCLISWFRNGDSRCPYCGNNGINHKKDRKNYGFRRSQFYNHTSYESQYLSDIRKYAYSKKNNDDKICLELRKKFEKIKSFEELQKNENENYKKFQDSLKTSPMIYNDARKILNNHRKNKWKFQKQIMLEKFKLINNSYIIPLIIPLTVNI